MSNVTRYHLTPVSGNGKTGPIAVTTTSRNSCWAGCPFRGVFCYGEQFHMRMHWDKVSSGQRGYDRHALCVAIETLPKYSMIRVNQVGDQPLQDDGETIDLHEALPIAQSCKKRKLKAWTYSHHKKTDVNLAAMRELTEAGLTVNASCETEEQVDRVYAQGGLAALVVPHDEKRTSWKTAGGVTVRVCPEQRGITENCQTCDAYCQKRTVNIGGGKTKPRDCVAFLAHFQPKKIKTLLKELNVR